MKGQITVNGETIFYDHRTAGLITFWGGDFIAMGELLRIYIAMGDGGNL